MLRYDPRDPHQIRELIFLCIAFLVVGYVTINAFVPNADMIVASRILQASASLVVMVAYASEAWEAFTGSGPRRSDFLIVGIWISFCAGFFQSVYAILFRLAGAPAWMLYMETVAPTVLLSVVAAACHVAAPGIRDGKVPTRNKIALGAILGLGTLGVGFMLFLKPDFAAFIERTPGWLRDFWSAGVASAARGP